MRYIMTKVTIIPPNISQEENDKNLNIVKKRLEEIVREVGITQNKKTRK